MRRVMLAGGVACAILLTHHAGAQNTVTGNTTTTSAGGGAMPGQAVSTFRGLQPVGQRLPNAAPPAGQPVTANALQRSYDPARPLDAFKGTNIDPKLVIAPLVGADGKPVKEPDALDKISEKIKAFFVGTPPPARPNFAPGVLRRAQDRADKRWRRD